MFQVLICLYTAGAVIEFRDKRISFINGKRTVFAKDAITADAYDNALMLMGVERALRYIEKRSGMAAFIIYKNKNGAITDTASSRFRDLLTSSVIPSPQARNRH